MVPQLAPGTVCAGQLPVALVGMNEIKASGVEKYVQALDVLCLNP